MVGVVFFLRNIEDMDYVTSTSSLNICVGKEEKDNELCNKKGPLCGIDSRCSWIGQPCSWVRLLSCDLAPAKSAKGYSILPGYCISGILDYFPTLIIRIMDGFII